MTKLSQFILILIFLLTPQFLCAQNVSDVRARQVGNKIEISYTLDKEANTTLQAIINGRTCSCNSVTGDIGTNMSAGRNVVIWDVLADQEKLVGDVSFQVTASMSSRDLQAYNLKQNKQKARALRNSQIYPFAGFDVNGGVKGFGVSIYWPWKSGPSRVGSYASYVYGLTDWENTEESGSFHNICLGVTITLSKHVTWFFAPGLSLVNEDGQLAVSEYRYSYDSFKSLNSADAYMDFDFDDYYDNYDFSKISYKFAAETGIGVRFLSCMMASVKVSYPLYIGFGVGFEFGGK